MSMLAERRQKQKWTLNPRGKFWTEDSNKIGQKMLEKMGWTKGKGLGINEQGTTEIYSVSHKSDTTGVGYDKNFEEWTEHQEKFGNFLQQLNSNRDQDAVKDGDTNLSGQSIELKSKQSRARVHYKKFTRGKDINKYKSKDLANIFGQKELAEKTPVKVEKDDSIRETEAPDFKNWYGVNTINCGNMVEYFKHKSNYSNKSDYLKCNVKSNNDTSLSSNMPDNQRTDSESENDQHVGFGFAPKTVDTSLSSCGALKDSDDKGNYAFDNPCLGLNSSIETAYSTNGFSVESTKKKKKKFESDSLHITEVDKNNTRKKLTETIDSDCKNGFINPALNLDTKPVKDCNGKEFEVFRTPINLENCNGSSTKSAKKRKKEFESDSLHITEVDKHNTRKKLKSEIIDSDCKNAFINPALDLDTKPEEDRNGNEFEVIRAQIGFENCNGSSTKPTKKRKKEFDSLHITEADKHNTRKKLKAETIDSDCKNGFINPALNLGTNPEEDRNGKEFEVFRAQFGLENCGLDLTDERNNKKRVTFNDHVMLYEYNINSAKKKKGEVTLDKFEVENKKSKKKRKRESTTTPVTNGFVNEALDVQILYEEINDNELNEHRNKKIKRKISKTSNLETIQESPEKEIIEINVESEDTLDISIVENGETDTMEQQSKKKKKKKEKKEKKAKVEDITVLRVINEKTGIEIEKTIEKKIKKDKESKEEEETAISKKCKKKKKKDKENCKSEKRAIQTEINNEQQDIKILEKSDSKQQNDLIENENKDAAVMETLQVSTTKEEEEKEEEPLEKIKHKKNKRKSISKEDCLNHQNIEILDKSDSKQQNDYLIEEENKDAAIIETLPVPTTKEEEKEEGLLEKIKHKKKKRKSIGKEDGSSEIDVCSVERKFSDKENTDKEQDPNTKKLEKKDKKSKKSKDKNVSDDVGDSSNPNKDVVNVNVMKQDKIENAEPTDTPSKMSKVIDTIDNIINSPWNVKARMSKRILITLFHNNAISEFPGSNIHNIKGYGTDEYDL